MSYEAPRSKLQGIKAELRRSLPAHALRATVRHASPSRWIVSISEGEYCKIDHKHTKSGFTFAFPLCMVIVPSDLT